MTQRKQPTSRPVKTGFWVIIAILAIWILLASGNSFYNTARLKQQVKSLERETAELKAQNDSLAHENERLKTDPEAAETAAREQFGLTKPGETVIRFVPAKESKEPK